VRRLFGGRLWHHPDFLKLWAGQSISRFGSEVTVLALPTAAIQLLGAGAFQIGLLGALEFVAFPTLGLFAGVWADRLSRRRILIVCDAVRALALGSIPLTYALGWLSMGQLFAVALVTGVGTVFFDVAYQAYLPELVPARDLTEGNSKLEIGRSAASVGGPALAGFLIQLIRPALAILVDAASFVVSVVSLFLIRRSGPAPAAEPALRPSFFKEMWEGIRVVLREPSIRLIAGCTATSNLMGNIVFAVFLLYAYKDLHLTPGQVGLIFGVGAVGALAGALVATPAARWLGLGPALLVSISAGSLAGVLVPLASLGVALPLLILSMFIQLVGQSVYNINQVSLRQAIIPIHLQGRMNATVRTVIWGTIPIGSVIGGALGVAIGILPTVIVGTALGFLTPLWILAGPVRLREIPASVRGATGNTAE
jgi:MFS family permease